MGDQGGAPSVPRGLKSSREATPRELPRTASPPSSAEMSDMEEEAPEVEAPAPNEPMDLMTALQQVLKKGRPVQDRRRGQPEEGRQVLHGRREGLRRGLGGPDHPHGAPQEQVTAPRSARVTPLCNGQPRHGPQ